MSRRADLHGYAERADTTDGWICARLAQGYLSFWNDSISYVLRGCILAELALRGRIGIVNDGGAGPRTGAALAERPIEVLNQRSTGEVLLDETLKIIKAGERASIMSWINFLSGKPD